MMAKYTTYVEHHRTLKNLVCCIAHQHTDFLLLLTRNLRKVAYSAVWYLRMFGDLNLHSCSFFSWFITAEEWSSILL